jgi:hypothetical protein
LQRIEIKKNFIRFRKPLAEQLVKEITLDSSFFICSYRRMEGLSFKIVKVQDSRDEVIALVDNFVIGKAAFDKALFVSLRLP